MWQRRGKNGERLIQRGQRSTEREIYREQGYEGGFAASLYPRDVENAGRMRAAQFARVLVRLDRSLERDRDTRRNV